MRHSPLKKQHFRKIHEIFVRSWFSLTSSEQKAVLIIIGIIVLGIIMSSVHEMTGKETEANSSDPIARTD